MGITRSIFAIGSVVAVLAGCGASGLIVKQPVTKQCASTGLKKCELLADAVGLYVDGDKSAAEPKLREVGRDPPSSDKNPGIPMVRRVPRDGIEPPTRGFSKQLESVEPPGETADFGGALRGSWEASDPDLALKDAIHAAVDAGQYLRAKRLLDVLLATPPVAAVVALESRRKR